VYHSLPLGSKEPLPGGEWTDFILHFRRMWLFAEKKLLFFIFAPIPFGEWLYAPRKELERRATPSQKVWSVDKKNTFFSAKQGATAPLVALRST